MRECVTRYIIKDKLKKQKSLFLVADGYPINLALGEGSPSDAIDITLSLMAEGAIYLVKKIDKVKPGVKTLPYDVSGAVTKYKLESMA